MPNRDRPSGGIPQTSTGNVKFSSTSARLPEEVSLGVLSTGAILLGAGEETIIDFLQGLGSHNHVVARVVLPNRVIGQLVRALETNRRPAQEPEREPPQQISKDSTESKSQERDNIPGAPGIAAGIATKPTAPSQRPRDSTSDPHETADSGKSHVGKDEMPGTSEAGSAGKLGGEAPPETTNKPGKSLSQTGIQDIYDELRLPDSLMAGSFANKVVVRNTGVECVLDFIAQLYPKPCVAARVVMAAGRVPTLVHSLKQHMATNRLK